MFFALCTPNDDWPNATAVGAFSLDGSFTDRELPVEHRAEGSHNIARSQYPHGLILIPIGNDPTGIPAVLPVIMSGASSPGPTPPPSNRPGFGFAVGPINASHELRPARRQNRSLRASPRESKRSIHNA